MIVWGKNKHLQLYVSSYLYLYWNKNLYSFWENHCNTDFNFTAKYQHLKILRFLGFLTKCYNNWNNHFMNIFQRNSDGNIFDISILFSCFCFYFSLKYLNFLRMKIEQYGKILNLSEIKYHNINTKSRTTK